MSNEIKELRHRLKLSQTELAFRVGATTNTVQRWEKGAKPGWKFQRALKKLENQEG